MKMSSKCVKLLFAAFAATLLIVFLPLNASAQTTVLSVNEAPTAVSNLYKYLQHVNVTEYGWPQGGYSAQNTNFNPLSSAPISNHILWLGQGRPYEALDYVSVVTSGVVIVPNYNSQSIYDDNNLYAFDQNTGKIIWTYPGLGGGIVIDDQHFLSGTTMINPATGEFLYTVPRSISSYSESMKMGFAGSGGRILGISFSDVENPTQVWQSEQLPSTSIQAYGDGKIFFGGGGSYYLGAVDATSGQKLWWKPVPEYVNRVVVGDDKIYVTGLTGGSCMDSNTGSVLWRFADKGREIGDIALAYNKVYYTESDQALWCLDADTGGMAWKYFGELIAPYVAGPSPTSWATMGYVSSVSIADGKVYFKSLGHTAYGTVLPPYWESIDGRQWNPYPYSVLAQPGIGQAVCLDAESGSLIWKCGPEEIGNPGPCLGTQSGRAFVVADGRVYATQTVHSRHISLRSPQADPEWNDATRQINYEWFPPYVYCFGKGPTQFEAVCFDKGEIKLGENVTIAGKLVDLSPAIDHISILSTYSRPVGSPAPNVPVELSFISSNGTMVPFATVNTDEDGMFSATWYPWETGSLQIVVESAGSDAYEAPEMTYTTISVAPVVPDLVPILEFAVALAVIMAIALPVIIYIRKPKQ